MSSQTEISNRKLFLAALLALIILAAATGLGLVLGELSAPKHGERLARELGIYANDSQQAPATCVDPAAPPVFFFTGEPKDRDWSVVYEEVGYAAAQGVHQFVVPVSPLWPGGTGAERVIEPLRRIAELDPRAVFLLQIDYNPPEAWLQEHLDAARTLDGKPLVFPSLASPVWLEGANAACTALLDALRAADLQSRLLGVSLSGLRDGRWLHPRGADDSDVNQSGFRGWLRGQYANDAALQRGWGDAKVTLATAAIPELPKDAETTQVFFNFPAEQSQAEFLAYTSEQTANVIRALAGHWKTTAELPLQVFANYGHSLDVTRNAAGHNALGQLLESELDGFVSPVSYVDRGLGGTGGLMGAVASAQYHGKRWLLIDDTRTGLEKDAVSGELTRLKGLSPRDVYNVQRRNFALALTHGMGIVWADPQGRGALCDASQWAELGAMRSICATLLRERKARGPAAAEEPPGVAVIFDENARDYQRCDEMLNALILQEARDAVLRSGVSARFCLLGDFLSGIVQPSPVYLFLNVFKLSDEDRERIHARLAAEGAAALWLYASGYFGEGPDPANVAALTGMKTKRFDTAERGGSVYGIEGTWLRKGATFGNPELLWQPLFYIDDDTADVLSHYASSGKPSVAIRYLDAGWTSVYIAEPALTPGLMREILHILEQQVYFAPTSAEHFDATFVGRGLLAVHGGDFGERLIRLPEIRAVRDLFDEDIGWPEADSFLLPLKAGETRLLKLSAVQE